MTTVTPVTGSTCRIDVVGAWNIFLSCAICDSDCEVFWAEVCGSRINRRWWSRRSFRSNPSLMLIDDADKPAKWYFALKQAAVDG